MISTSIYPSTEVHPYVYYGVHKITNQFYYGYREANAVPSNEDFGVEYKTSSKKIENIGFDNFEWTIIAEFYGKDSGYNAYVYEQGCIKSVWKDPLSLNGHFIDLDTGKEFKQNKSAFWKIQWPDKNGYPDKNGKIRIIHNMRKFCRFMRLSQSAMVSVSKGKSEHHYGFTCEKLSDDYILDCPIWTEYDDVSDSSFKRVKRFVTKFDDYYIVT